MTRAARDGCLMRRMPARWIAAATAIAIATGGGAVPGCTQTAYRATFTRDKNALRPEDGDFLKCHTRDGRVYVLEHWVVGGDAVTGQGREYDAERRLLREGAQTVPLAAVVLFETNRPETIPRSPAGYVVLGIVSAVSIGITAFCLANTKACFGSCPTFYVHDGERWRLQAEGFSASVARPLEETDVDAMWTARATDGRLEIEMTNEALETHLVDHVRVLAALRPAGKRVFRAGDHYFAGPLPAAPSACRAGDGAGVDCLADVRAIDDRAYLSAADPEDLAAKETLTLSFARAAPARRLGLVVAARNSLLNTFVFYQGLSYAGRSVGSWYAALERQGPAEAAAVAESFRAFGRTIGGIKVEVEEAPGVWRDAGAYDEVGPIAQEVQVVPLSAATPAGGDVRVRLTMTKGYWKLDQLGLTTLDDEIRPTAVEPSRVVHGGKDDPGALARLRPGGDRLVTYPGDLYKLHFDLPGGDEAELFLESRGYYYEWMRQQWLTEESPVDIARMLADPAGSMRALAPRYKKIEDRMEAIFWSSRVGVRP